MTVATEVMEVVHDRPPAEVIMENLKGWLEKVQPTAGDILIAVYERGVGAEGSTGEKKTTGGIIVPTTASRAKEDKFQGIVGLVVGMGPDFHSRYDRELGLDPPLQKGDWVTCNIGDASSFVLGKTQMRLVQGNFIRLRVTDPDCVI